MNIDSLLPEMVSREASDLFLVVGSSPRFRVQGRLEEAGQDAPHVTEAALIDFLERWLPPFALERFKQERELDSSVSLNTKKRFRLNLYQQRGLMGLAVRHVPLGQLDFDELAIPPAVRELATTDRGLILITGAAGAGKSTTLAAMLHHINANSEQHIVTIEDPIEFLHDDLRSMVAQREIGNDTLSFAQALKHVLRLNPDAIFIDEMRDLETMRTAISAAQAGHLVVSAMHSADVIDSIEQILNAFPENMRRQVAVDLSNALTGVLSQRLVIRKDGQGRVPAFEILTPTTRIRRLIRRQDLHGLLNAMKASGNEAATFTQSLVSLFRKGFIACEDGAALAGDQDEFLRRVQGMETGVDTLRSRLDHAPEDQSPSIRGLLQAAMRTEASDLIITAEAPPFVRRGGEISQLRQDSLTAADTRHLIFSLLSPAQRVQFEIEKELDLALTVTEDTFGTARFRVNAFYQKGTVAAAFRVIPSHIPDPAQLGIPSVVMRLALRHQGLILITGPTGHGKSTTLACLIDKINRNRSCHIVTIEDPIEFVHSNNQAVIEQREVHADTHSFASALKYVLRQDPDVILIGEMRDTETIAAALTAAETGHLVLATLHTNDAPQTVDRIIDIFPGERQNQIRTQLAATLDAVVAQRLLPLTGRKGERIAAFEVMLGTPGIRAQIRESRTHQLVSSIETGSKDGMITLDKALMNLYTKNLISRASFKAVARNPNVI